MSTGVCYITTQGAILSAKTLQGKKLEITKFTAGDGYLTDDSVDAIKALTNLVSSKISFPVTNIVRDTNTRVKVQGTFRNIDIAEAFYFRELGLWAIDPDTVSFALTTDTEINSTKTYYTYNSSTGEYTAVSSPALADIGTYYERSYTEVLFSYINYGDVAEYINNSISEVQERFYTQNIVVDNASNVTITIDPYASYATIRDLQQAVDDLEEEIDTKISSVYKYKGSVNAYSNLPTTGQKVGDVYNIETADSTHGIKAGDNVAWNGTSWDSLAGTVDLSAYITTETAANTYVTKSSIAPNTMNLTPNMFIQDGDLYKCTITNTQVTAASNVWVDISKDTMSIAEEAGVKTYVTTNVGSFDIYADAVPSANITGSYIILGGA